MSALAFPALTPAAPLAPSSGLSRIPPALVDGLGREIRYLRLSVTDRCDFRCVYCMAEHMTFLPRAEVLSLEEIFRVARIFSEQGVRKFRLTGGEPLVRKGIVGLCRQIAQLPALQLRDEAGRLGEVVLTTNGSQLGHLARPLAEAGVSRLNISLDSLDPALFRALTRTGDLVQVLNGIEAAQDAGFSRLKLNTVVMKGRNDHEIPDLVAFAIARGLDITFIEEMPLGEVGRARGESLMTSDEVREQIARRYTLQDTSEQSGGPARYVRVQGHPNTRIGFISPHSHNFCGSCNRVRLTAEGRLLLCLGQEHSLDVRGLLRESASDTPVLEAIRRALHHKPAGHTFSATGEVQIVRFMNASGG